MRWVFALVIATGCYAPSPSPGAPCGEDGLCPSGLECRADICVLPGTQPSDGPGPDVRTDGPPSDSTEPPTSDGPVNLTGCSDGEREGFKNDVDFPTIAGCEASWSGPKDMRAAATGQACGDDANQLCAQPADACAAGWSVCGRAGMPDQITSRTNAADCFSAGGADAGAFASAMSHCSAFMPECVYDTPFACAPNDGCSESICCGPACSADIGCPDGLFPGTTRVAGNFESGCGALDPSLATGVLCCKD